MEKKKKIKRVGGGSIIYLAGNGLGYTKHKRFKPWEKKLNKMSEMIDSYYLFYIFGPYGNVQYIVNKILLFFIVINQKC